MSIFQQVKEHWQPAFEKMTMTPGFQRLLSREITKDHYASIMRQIFHHARENPQIQALATVYFRGEQRNMVKMFLRHALSEVGHDQLALNDLMALGVDTKDIPNERPLPSTTALLAYAFYQIQHLNPIGYLGYLFHLEFMPTSAGKEYMSALSAIGIPNEALGFIQDHASIDVTHNKWMESYAEELIRTPEEFDAVIYAAQTTADLYGRMITEAVEVVDQKSYGLGLRLDAQKPVVL